MSHAPNTQSSVFCGSTPVEPEVDELIRELLALPPMNKRKMSGQCAEETYRMVEFMQKQLGMRPIRGYFVQGVRAFAIDRPVADMPPETVLTYGGDSAVPPEQGPVQVVDVPDGEPLKGSGFHFTAGEAVNWQKSFVVYALKDHYGGDDGVDLIMRSLRGGSAAGPEAFKMKFALRISENPILCEFDGVPIDRPVGGPLGKILLVSTCGVDFAARIHDVDDLKTYIRNWDRLVYRKANGEPYVDGGRDICCRESVDPDFDEIRFLNDVRKMAAFRLMVLDRLGVQAMVEVGIGLGVFAGDQLGIGRRVRTLTARGLREALEWATPHLHNIKVVVCALPRFRVEDNIDFYKAVFAGTVPPDAATAYQGSIPVVILDQDMHKIARTCALKGLHAPAAGALVPRFVTSELNPGDSHGVIGEYWMNLGPGTEEKLALTTCALLTQHHAVNPYVTRDRSRYLVVDPTAEIPLPPPVAPLDGCAPAAHQQEAPPVPLPQAPIAPAPMAAPSPQVPAASQNAPTDEAP